MAHCIVCTTPNSQLICPACLTKIRRARFLGCARCGASQCQLCTALPSFTFVKSLFFLQNIYARWISQAKDQNNPIAVKLFEDAFISLWVEKILELVMAYNIDAIVLAPIRLNRISSRPWHPILSLYTQLKEQGQIKGQTRGIYFATHTETDKMSHLNRDERLKKSVFPFTNMIWEQHTFQESDEKKIKKVLLIDDVLTSGTTSLRCQNSYMPFQVENGAEWHLLTLFRTPTAS